MVKIKLKGSYGYTADLLSIYGSSDMIAANGAAMSKDGKIVALWGVEHKKLRLESLSSLFLSLQDEKGGEEIPVNGSYLSLLATKDADIFEEGMRFVLMGDPSLLQKAVFIKGEEDSEEMDKKIETIIRSSVPVPVKKEWESYFFKKVRELYLEELELYGDTPYKSALLLRFSPEDRRSMEEMGKIAVRAAARHEFEERFGRAPRLEWLYDMVNPKKFAMKEWSNFLRQEGVDVKNITASFEEKFPRHKAPYIIWAFEVFGSKTGEMIRTLEKVSDLHSIPLKECAIATRKDEERRYLKDLVSLIKEIAESKKEYKHLILQRVLTDPLRFKSLQELEDSLGEIVPYSRVEEVCVPLAVKAASLMMREDLYEDYQREYLNHIENILYSARRYPTVQGSLNAEYSWESMDMQKSDSWFAGLETNCCQHLHGAGASCVLYAAENPSSSGIFVVRKKGRIVAQSWFWIKDGVFCFDNIEVLGKEVRSSILKCYEQFVDQEIAPRARLFGIKKVTIGLGFNDISTLKEKFPYEDNPTLPGSGVYTDARRQVLMRTFNVARER